MTTEQQIIWLSWYNYDDCKELFEAIKPDMFHTANLSNLYKTIRDSKMDFSPTALDSISNELVECGIQDRDSWVPIRVENFRTALIEEWIKAKGNDVLSLAHKELNSGGDYRAALKEFDKIDTEHMKKQTTLADYFDEISEEHAMGKTKGLPTGIPGLDKYTQQLKKGHFWVIAASTNTGKTTMALQIAKKSLLAGHKVDIVTLEMSAKQLLERIAWLHATEAKVTFERAIIQLVDVKLTITENIRTVDSLRAHLETSEAELVVVDYIQLVRGDGSYYENATGASNMLQEMAIKRMIPIIGLSQVTKESYKAGASHMMDFKGSGAIAESADVAMEIYRDRDNEAEIADVKLFLKKNRHGQTGEIKGVSFDTKSGCFRY